MTILFVILKIIGIILLIVLAFVFVLLLLVLYAPFAYKISGAYEDEQSNYYGSANIKWLFIHIFADITKKSSLSYGVKIFGIKIYPKDKKKKINNKKNIKKEITQNEIISSVNVDNAAKNEENTECHINDKEHDNESNDIINNDKLENLSSSQKISKNSTLCENEIDYKNINKDNINKNNLNQDKNRKNFNPAAPVDFIDSLMIKFSDLINKVSDFIYKLLKKEDHVLQFLDKPYTKRTLKRLKKIIKKFFKTISPKKSRGYLHFGLSNAADTGIILGKMSVFFPLYAKWLNIEPDFEHEIIEGNINVKGRIFIGIFIVPALFTIIGKDFKKTFNLIKKI